MPVEANPVSLDLNDYENVFGLIAVLESQGWARADAIAACSAQALDRQRLAIEKIAALFDSVTDEYGASVHVRGWTP
jgi:hypothetical protein